MQTPLCSLLRDHTAAYHAQLMQHELGTALQAGTVTRSMYGQHLQGMVVWYQRLEPALIPALTCCDEGLRSLYHARLPALLADLEILQVAAPEPLQPPYAIAAEAAPGWLYVVEGSRLGGLYMAQALRAQLGLSPERGLQFFHGMGPAATPLHWQAVQQQLAAAAPASCQAEAATQGAQQAYETLFQALGVPMPGADQLTSTSLP